MLCYFNVPKFRAYGVHYFDPDRSWMLHKGEDNPANWYDTGASLLEDVLAHKPNLVGLNVDIRPMVVHMGGGSYKNVSLKGQAEWLTQHKDLWEKESESRAESRGQVHDSSAKNHATCPRDSESKPKTAKRTNKKEK
jgi:hypothetical protein